MFISSSASCRLQRSSERDTRVFLLFSGVIKFGAGNGIRTRDFDLGKVALYH